MLTVDVSDQLHRLVNKMEDDPGSLTSEEVKQYDSLLRAYVASAPFTPQQCKSLAMIVDHNVHQHTDISLDRLLS